MVPGYPKIFAVGNDYIPNLFKGEVEVTEKVDGSMFGFGLSKDGLVMRSKGQQLVVPNVQKLFTEAVDYVLSIENIIRQHFGQETYFYAEYLQKPRHNTLKYDRIPQNHLILFGVHTANGWVTNHSDLQHAAEILQIETVPLLYRGNVEHFDELKNMVMGNKSILGNELIEGVVVKNYNQFSMVGNLVFPSFGKYVREEFKERNHTEWKRGSSESKIDTYLKSFKTEARWHKAVQHLKDSGELLNDPKDIGRLFKEIHNDIVAEESENIKNELYNLYIDQVKRTACSGFAEWYKEQLAKRSFSND